MKRRARREGHDQPAKARRPRGSIPRHERLKRELTAQDWIQRARMHTLRSPPTSRRGTGGAIGEHAGVGDGRRRQDPLVIERGIAGRPDDRVRVDVGRALDRGQDLLARAAVLFGPTRIGLRRLLAGRTTRLDRRPRPERATAQTRPHQAEHGDPVRHHDSEHCRRSIEPSCADNPEVCRIPTHLGFVDRQVSDCEISTRGTVPCPCSARSPSDANLTRPSHRL